MTYEIEFHPEVKFDIKESYWWYEEKSEGLGDSFFHALESSYTIIQESPSIWPKQKNIFHKYKLKKFPFSILYSVEDRIIYVVAVAHSSRKPSYWEERAST